MEINIKREIGKRIAEIRNKNGLSQSEFAEKVNSSQGFISEVEKGKKAAGVELLYMIAKAFHTDLNYIITGLEEGEHLKELTKVKEQNKKLESEKNKLYFEVKQLHKIAEAVNEYRSTKKKREEK